jgi:hypothetical protein
MSCRGEKSDLILRLESPFEVHRLQFLAFLTLATAPMVMEDLKERRSEAL